MKSALLALAVVLATLAACDAVVVDLGRTQPDAAPDAMSQPDANPCRCRIMSCRDASDCTAIGLACGADQYCVGDLGPCTGDAECRALDANAVCTAASDSIAACPM